MRILFCKWNGCCEAAMEAALIRLGYQVDSLFYQFEGADYASDCLALLQRQFEKQSYDIVFSHNFIPIVARVCRIYKRIYVSWVMDSPAYHLYSQALESPYNRVFLFDRQLYQKFHPRNPSCIYYQPLATGFSEAVFSNPHPKRDFSADVSFLGSLYIDEAVYDTVEGVPPYMQGYLDGLIEAQLNVYGYNFLEEAMPKDLVQAYAKLADWAQYDDYERDEADVVCQTYLGKKCTQLERIRISEALAESPYAYKLYTNSPLPKRLESCFQGVAGYYDEMPWVFRESKVNLNITSKGIQSGLPLRLFDIMGCGGFVLTNYQPELSCYFEIGKELAVYESIPHLLCQVEYYLAHEEEREEIARNGYRKVQNCFTFDIALADILALAVC